MNRFVVVLVIGLGLVLVPRAGAADEPCRATAVLEGDAALVDSLTSTLNLRGVATKSTARCPFARARIDRRGETIAVSVVDADGRRSERTLADLDAATALIESWARHDMNAALLVGMALPAAPVAASATVSTAATASLVPQHGRDRVTVAAGVESSLAFDGALWFGGRLTGCARIGFACLGVTGRGLSSGAAIAQRSYDVLGSVEVPFQLGRGLVLVTGLGAGAGWFQSRDLQTEVATEVTTVGVRADGHAALAISLGRHVALHVGVSFGLSPFASDAVDEERRTETGEPRGFVRGDAGLRIGAP